MIDIKNIKAIDFHTHAEVSCRQPHDDYRPEIDEGVKRYFKSDHRPTIQETIDYYRDLQIAFVMFSIDAEFELGKNRIPNEEIYRFKGKIDELIHKSETIKPQKPLTVSTLAKKLNISSGYLNKVIKNIVNPQNI